VTNQTDQQVTEEGLQPEAVPTSLNPYGQLLKMLQPRALNIAIYDREGVVLWTASDCESAALHELVEDVIANNLIASTNEPVVGSCRPLDGEVAYLFSLCDSGQRLLGIVVIVVAERANDTRTVDYIHGLLRPALETLSRELAHQYSLDLLQRDLKARDGDLQLLLGDSAHAESRGDDTDFGVLLDNCIRHLACPLGLVLIPDRNIAVYRAAPGLPAGVASDVLTKAHRHLIALIQVQRRSVILNRQAAAGPLQSLPFKILACPVYYGAQRVAGALVIFKHMQEADFSLREIHIVELLARRVTHVLQDAYDVSTGLLTRPALEKRASALLQDAAVSKVSSVLYADIDRVHVLNETFGMHVGDEAIGRVAEIIRSGLGPRVLAARISGDRFALFLPGMNATTAQQSAETLCRRITELDYRVGGKRIEISVSFGVAPVETAAHPLSYALATAEAACKAAKDRGRGRVAVFADADQSIIRRVEDVELIGVIREALDQDRFQLDAQPIVELQVQTGRKKFELLLRMLDPQGKVVGPAKFLPAAERYQLAPAIDRWVINYVLEMVSACAPRLLEVGAEFAVNISGQSLGDPEFVVFLEERLRTYALPPSLLSFELTETAAVSNIVHAETLMRKLRALGHDIALDDFGRGLSSLTYLKSLPVTCVKIDGDLVRDVTHNQSAQAMVSAVVQLAKAMHLKTTAECIESDEICQTITQLGVDQAQGFAIGRPQSLEVVLRELVSNAGANSRPAYGHIKRIQVG